MFVYSVFFTCKESAQKCTEVFDTQENANIFADYLIAKGEKEVYTEPRSVNTLQSLVFRGIVQA